MLTSQFGPGDAKEVLHQIIQGFVSVTTSPMKIINIIKEDDSVEVFKFKITSEISFRCSLPPVNNVSSLQAVLENLQEKLHCPDLLRIGTSLKREIESDVPSEGWVRFFF